jgi:hypothetical protein
MMELQYYTEKMMKFDQFFFEIKIREMKNIFEFI